MLFISGFLTRITPGERRVAPWDHASFIDFIVVYALVSLLIALGFAGYIVVLNPQIACIVLGFGGRILSTNTVTSFNGAEACPFL